MSDTQSEDRTERFVNELEDEWARSEFERDRDRILYTRELRRLKDVTQVARSGESYLYHDRLSHSLKVAQVGRGLARILRQWPREDDIDVETILDSDVVKSVFARKTRSSDVGPSSRSSIVVLPFDASPETRRLD
ncbi:hypothetical protein [Halococcoides cellulosivorans]|uniref:Uncharacterized protein n=1 Tax=Halococcoides cellulosivorans TaxID=1679096 RepID=A0A2R4X3V5_9EURY|nr:hypothetical protein [Halococcoides cellulosivorans]AWB28469.1 hypothetical protein HARCEL1_12540 [Halococcoides cellulosivorans]